MAVNLTEQELETLHKGVTGAGLLVSLSDRSFFDTFKEAGALAKHLGQARQRSSSEVVKQVAGMRGTGFGMTAQPDQVERETIDALRQSVATLQTKAPDELDDYRNFVVEVARSVGAAARGGETAEAGALGKIQSALGFGGEPG